MLSAYDYTFVSSVAEEDICPICSSPMKEPVQTICGHRFCRFCLEEAMKRTPECPIDRRTLETEDIFPDRASERKILDYRVKCPNENDGCQWIGELRNVEAHENSCFFVRVRCTNEDCDVTMLRSDLQRHLNEVCPQRVISCQHCRQNYVWCLEEEHFNNCQEFPCTCSQMCGQDDIPRNKLNSHLERECDLTEVSCSYAHVGCQVTVPRNALERHLQFNIETHLNLACEKLQVMQNESIITNERLEELEDAAARNNNMEALQDEIVDKIRRLDALEASLTTTSTLEISKTNTKLKQLETTVNRRNQEHNELIENTRRIVEGLQYEIEDVKRRLGELSSTSIRTGAESQAAASRSVKLPTLLKPTAPPFPQPTTRLLRPGRRLITSGYERLPDMTEDESANVDEQRQQEIPNVNPMHRYPQELSTEINISNKFIWKFTQIDDALQKAKDDSKTFYCSDPFHSGPYGYRMCVEFHPNGLNDGCNTHLSIFVCLLKGEYDDILPWPFNQKVTITLLDQQPIKYLRRNVQMSSIPRKNANLSRCYSKPSESRERNTAFGFCKFITHERLKSRRYLVNETIFICVEVERLNSIL